MRPDRKSMSTARRWFVLGLLLIAVVTPLAAEVELTLTDGRVISGVDVRLEGEAYLLELTGGEVVAIPVAAVLQIHLHDRRTADEGVVIDAAKDLAEPGTLVKRPEDRIESRPGWRRGVAQDLAGAPWQLPNVGEQTAALGPPSVFQQGPAQFRFKPTHAWDRDNDVLGASRSTWPRQSLNTLWKPSSAFDFSVDVLERGRSRWAKSPSMASWNPADGLSREQAERWWDELSSSNPSPPAPPVRARLPWDSLVEDCHWCRDATPNQATRFSEPRPAEMTAERCARSLFAALDDAETVQWAALEQGLWDNLPLGFHEAWVAGGTRAVYTIAGNRCRLFAGDLQPLLGVELTPTHALAYAVSAWNETLAANGLSELITPTQQLDFSFALVQLFESACSGMPRAQLQLLETRAQSERWSHIGTACTKSTKFREDQHATLTRMFSLARVVFDDERTHVRFLAWLSLDGEVNAYDLELFPDGRITLARETVVQHVGEHEDSR